MLRIISILMIGIALSACAGMPVSLPTPGTANTPVSPSTACDPPSSWTIRYSRSGGFAGFNESLTLGSGGNLKVQSERPPVDVQKTISDDQVEVITELLVQACPFESVLDKADCADCFVYELDIQMDGRTYSIQASDVTMGEELQPLMSALSQLLQDAGQ